MMLAAEITRPDVVTVVTQNLRPMDPGARKLVLDSGRRGETSGDILAQCQAGEDMVNWLIDTDGTVYELAGWAKAVPGLSDAYVVRLVAGRSDEQTRSLTWLLDQLSRKKGVQA